MADYQIPSELLGLPNVKAVSYQITSSERIEIFIESSLEAAVCPDCQQVSAQIHDTAEPQMIRDLAIWDRQCWLRYAQYIYQRARREDLAQIAQDEGLSQDMVRGIFERWAKKRSPSGGPRS